MWQESIVTNAPQPRVKKRTSRSTSRDDWRDGLHALDYLTYAYLQSEQDDNARQVVEAVARVTALNPDIGLPGSYALASIPARYAMERHAWLEAASLIRPDAAHTRRDCNAKS